jgi:xylan 1,4-beta-xylosidase
MTRHIAAGLLSVIAAAHGTAQTPSQRTYANPLDIDYRYNFEQLNEGISYRSGADPVIVVQRGEYYLFETIGDGYWHSRDLGTWRHVTPTRWPLTDIVAPAVLSVRDTIYLLPSTTRPMPILMLTQPSTGEVQFYNRLLPWLPMARDNEARVLATPDSVQPGPWDPQFFHDPATERWFLYWNSSNAYPLNVIELDKTKRLAYKGTPNWLFGLEPAKHGWERFGQDHRDTTITPFIEGAWMTKHRGKYYLQYGAPGTEHNVYATGTYVSDDPMGPFSYAPYNPVAYKPDGFVQGAGHGNTFQDVHGNWWNTGTPWIGVNWNFERRIGLHPAGFDGDGQMYVDTRFGDFPHWLPTTTWRTSDDLFTGWMLLSYMKPVTASTQRDSFPASRITDENPRTFWVAKQNNPGEWLTIDLGRAYDLKAIQVNYADYRSGLYGTDSTVVTQFRLRVSDDGAQWRTVADLSGERRDPQRVRRAGDADARALRPLRARSRRRCQSCHQRHPGLRKRIGGSAGNAGGSDRTARPRRTQCIHHVATRATRRRLQRAVGDLAVQVVSDVPAVRRPGQPARAAGAHGGTAVLGGHRELRREWRVDVEPGDADSLIILSS